MHANMTTQERQLCEFLADLPDRFSCRYTAEARRQLLESLFWSLAGGKPEYVKLFFGEERPAYHLSLRDAQGAVDGAEYTEAARGKPCGHIFKAGEASYHCSTCSTDDTCCLCSRCFDSTDHTNHMVRVSITQGSSSCCDCGDKEAWVVPMFCTIHSDVPAQSSEGEKAPAEGLPEDLVANMAMTVGRVFDYVCDVISCSPEQLRQPKTEQSVERDELLSRLKSRYYGRDCKPCPEFSLLLWNDEKHTVENVQQQIARACRVSRADALARAQETDGIGRSILQYNTDVPSLLRMARVLEQIRVTVTIRSARDTFREQMCGTMVEWLCDIGGCSVGTDHGVLRRVVCEEMLKPWAQGSAGTHALVGKNGIDDEDKIEEQLDEEHGRARGFLINARIVGVVADNGATDDNDNGNDNGNDNDNDNDNENDADNDEEADAADGGNQTPSTGAAEDDDDDNDVMMVDVRPEAPPTAEMDWRQGDQALEEDEATMAGYPPPPPPPPQVARQRRAARERDLTPSDSDTAEPLPLIAPSLYAKANIEIPKTPGLRKAPPPRPGRHWLEVPAGYRPGENVLPAEDVFQRVRLDWLMLFDLRMWKKVRNDLKSLYISTVVQIPEFKRALSLRFAGLYTMLSQLYLVADREPDHSIVNISLQMLTMPSITAEVVERGNFMTTLLAIFYTFFTTRQVGHPWDVSSNAVLAFDSGSVNNRRMYHFYADLKYLFGSPYVQDRILHEERYLLQFLDLVKLHQGIGPNKRAVGEHVEYEPDSWVTAQLITRQINQKARLFVEAFQDCPAEDLRYLTQAISLTAKTVILNSIGADRGRFNKDAEIVDEVRFCEISDFEFDSEPTKYKVVKFVVEDEAISFHHALHYTLSWLIECAKYLPVDTLRGLLSFTAEGLRAKPRCMGPPLMPKTEHGPEDYLMAAFDIPLRVCAWLAQIKANMWVRNGISLRHQAAHYRNVTSRDVSHQRDIFLLQTAMVVCDPSRVLVSIVDRFGMEKWVKGIFEQKSESQDDNQHLDVVEDMMHLLIVLLSDRMSLIPGQDEPQLRILAMRRDITHVLCFKPLSFNDISNKVPERYPEQEEFHRVLHEMTVFKHPEGISDVGTFELRPEYVEDIDPYIAHYNKNQREEAEAAYRKRMAKKTGKSADDIVYEPKLRPIPSGAFRSLASFTSTGMFAQIVYYSLLYPLLASKLTPKVPFSRVETFIQVVLHLVLIAISEDSTDEDEMVEESLKSFVFIALTRTARSNFLPDSPSAKTIVALLDLLSTKEEFKVCHAKIAVILKRMRQKQPRTFESAYIRLGVPVDRISTSSPANSTAEEERERKKQAALSRQARVLAQFQQQQKSFLENQTGMDWDSDMEDDAREPETAEDKTNVWKFPAGTCILCQEETDERRLYGTFALFTESRVLRQTSLQDADFVREASQTPCSLDRSAEEMRPFGVAGENRTMISKINSKGEEVLAERQTIGKGFPSSLCRSGPVSIGCGHLMHYACFELYYDATTRRHLHQIARHHPEDSRRLEFVCPLCKALGNAFLPIIWKGQEESYPGALSPRVQFAPFLKTQPESTFYTRVVLKPGPMRQGEATTHPYQNKYTGGSSAASAPLSSRALWPRPLNLPGLTAPASLAENFVFTPLRATHEPTARAGQLPDAAGRSAELQKAYRRLREALRAADFTTRHTVAGAPVDISNGLAFSDTLATSFGYSISAVEIQQRGIEAQYGATLLEKIPEQVLTHLRILGETASSAAAVALLKDEGNGEASGQFLRECERQHFQLFVAPYLKAGTERVRRLVHEYPPLLRLDLFLFLSESMFGLAQSQSIDVLNMVRICYLAEMVKVVFHMSRNIAFFSWTSALHSRKPDGPAALDNFAAFATWVTERGVEVSDSEREMASQGGSNAAFNQPGLDGLEGYYGFVRKYALTFVRKCAILLHVKFGVALGCHVSPSPDADELERLTTALRLPTLDELCAAVTLRPSKCSWPLETPGIVQGWIRHEIMCRQAPDDLPSHAVISHPAIFELVGLPKNYDTLIEEAARRRCPTTGGELNEPVICLLCGEMICCQTQCCAVEEVLEPGSEPTFVGGVQQHMSKRCQGNIGIFISIRKCTALYLFRRSGSYSIPPYIDKYGETDYGFRHNRQLFLHQRRYDMMFRNVILSHGVPTFISRKLESEINNGGWETL